MNTSELDTIVARILNAPKTATECRRYSSRKIRMQKGILGLESKIRIVEDAGYKLKLSIIHCPQNCDASDFREGGKCDACGCWQKLETT